jgi:hypothetical protein
MPKCEQCGKEMIIPYECSFCGRYFCVEHRLPENHNCPNLSPRTSLEWKVEEKPIEEERMAWEGELHFIKESVEEQKVEKPKPRGKLKYIVPLFCIILILASYANYSFGYNSGSNASFNRGYEIGHNDGYLDGNLTGYELGYNQGVIDGAGTGYNIRDPTYQEMLNFIASDRTDENEYSENYTCFHFTADVKNNAFEEGYRCGFVYILFPDSAHTIVCFNTTDHGLIFIEPQFDDIVTLSIDQSYSNLNGYEQPDYNDTIISFTIIW